MRFAAETLIGAALVMAIGFAWGLVVFRQDERSRECAPCVCASEPFTYPPPSP